MKAILLALPVLLALGGCLHYQLGTTLPPELRSVHVPSVRNASQEPGLDTIMSSSLLREIQREGTLVITAEELAATSLEIVIVRFRMDPVRFQRDETRTPDEYRATVVAEVSFTQIADGRALYRGTVEGDATFAVGSDLVSAKHDILPEVCEDLSRKIVERCISIW